MRWLDRIVSAVRDVIGRRRFEREMDDELRAFEAMVEEDERRAGHPADAARRAARLRVGGRDQAKERIRAVRFGSRLETVLGDLRQGVRLVRRQPGFSLMVVLILSLGIGANAALYSVVRSVLSAPLPFADSGRLVRILSSREGSATRSAVSPLYFQTLREESVLLERVAAQRYQSLTLTGDGDPERVVGIGVSDGWQATLGVRPVLGRGFDAAEQAAGSASRVVLLSDGFWRRRFAGAAGIVGRTLRLNGERYTVIGVMPPQFRYPYLADLWLPMTFPLAATSPGDLNVPARMRAGVTRAEVQAEAERIAARLSRETPGQAGISLFVRPFGDEFQRDPNRSIAALLVAVGFVLLIACVNVANLMLARSGSRLREVAVRAALGASRARQLRQLLTESLVVAGLGGVLGTLLAVAATGWLDVLIPSRLGEVIGVVRLDPAVLGAAAALTVLTGVLFGLPPAVRLTGSGLSGFLGQRSRGGGGRVLDGLVVTEVALALVLLTGAGLMLRNFARILRSDVGYEADGLVRINVGFPEPGYATPDRRVAAVAALVERVEAVPGVVAAAVTSMQPIPRTTTNTGTALVPGPAFAEDVPPLVNLRLVTPGYFETLGIPVVRGRGFTGDDVETTEPVLIVNESAARKFWPDHDPIGLSVKPSRREDETMPWHRIVGVVADIAEPSDDIPGTVYRVYPQAASSQPPGSWYTTTVVLMVRTASGMPAPLDAIRAAVRDVDPRIPLFDIASMRSALEEPLADRRLGTALSTGFGLFGLLMAALGTYGVLAWAVSRRVPEFGVRMALGARPIGILAMVMRGGLRLLAVGLAVGLVASMAVTRVLTRIVPDLDPWDPLAFGLAIAALLVAGLAACWIPARRATRVDPVRALRTD
ncbi:MAG: ABC transporter permease [Gemmatimonadota bacterium]